MKSTLRVAVLITLLCAGRTMAVAESKPLELKWSEVAPLISGNRVTLELLEGGPVKGEVVAVREDSILMDVARGVAGYKAGSGTVPRGSIGLIRLERRRGSWGRSLGTVLGVMGGVVLGAYAAFHTDSAGAGIPVFIGISSVSAIGGYYAGRQLDRRVTRIKIVP